MSNKKVVNKNDDQLLSSILGVISKNNSWAGTMTDLRLDLVKFLGKRNSVIVPGSPGALRVVINRILNKLRVRGVSVKFTRAPDRTRTRFVRFSC